MGRGASRPASQRNDDLRPGGTDAALAANMLWTIAVILLVLWALGLVTSYTMGGFIHLLLVLAVVVVLVRVIQGRKILT